MKDTLNRNDTRIRTVGIGMLRKLISESTASSTSLLARFWSELLPSESEIERLFTEDAAQTLCISVLNLVYLAVNSTAHEKVSFGTRADYNVTISPFCKGCSRRRDKVRMCSNGTTSPNASDVERCTVGRPGSKRCAEIDDGGHFRRYSVSCRKQS